MIGNFRPEIWSQALVEQMRLNILYPGRRDERSRQGHTEVTPYTKTEIKARKKAVKAWQALTDELLAKGWLVDDYDGYFPNDETEHRQWVYDETEDERQARVAALPPLPDTVTIPATPRPILNDENTAHLKAALNTES